MVTILKSQFACGLLLCLTFIAFGPTRISAQQNATSLAEIFPSTTAIFVQAKHPDRLIEKIERHPLVASVSALPPVKKMMASPEFAMALLGKGIVESKIGEPLLDAIKSCLGEGMAIGVDAKTEAVAIVFHAREEAKLKLLAGAILNVAEGGASNNGKPKPFKKGKYREFVTAKFDNFVIGRYQSWFVIANKMELAKQIADNLMEHPSDSLATQSWFIEASKQQADADVGLSIDLATLRDRGLAKNLFQGRTDNPAAELVLGGLFDAIHHAPHAAADLNLSDDLKVEFYLPFQSEWANQARHFFYGEELGGTAPTSLLPKNIVTNLTAYRDVADWWLSKEDLFSEAVIAKMAQADSQLSTIFSGMDFGEDVLGALQPGVQIVVTEKKFADSYRPDIQLPAFALVGKLKDPDQVRRKLKIAFQSVIGFANINLGMNGQPQLDMETETVGDAKITATEYVMNEGSSAGLLLYNFSPTMGFQGDYLIVSSDRDLALELARLAAVPELSEKQTANASAERANTSLKFDGRVLSRILKSNQDALIAQNMLEKGHGHKEAEQEIGILLTAVDLVDSGHLDLVVQPDQMKVNLKLSFIKNE